MLNNNIDLAVSLYGFTERFIKESDYGIEQMFQELNQLGVKKYEIVGAQAFKDYPIPTEEEINSVIEFSEKYDVEAYSYGGYIDMGKVTDHDMSDEEMINEVVLDLMIAKKLGCKILRAPYLPVRLLAQVAMFAELYQIKIGYEMHAPDKPSDKNIVEYIKELEELNSEWVGIIPDFGCFIERPNIISIEKFINMGAKRVLLKFIIDNRWNGYTEETMIKKITSMGGGEVEKIAISEWFGFMSFGPADLKGFKKLLPYCIYFHGKFYHLEEDCIETTIPYEALVRMIVESGYSGTILSEYEGHAFDLDDAVEQLERHFKMVKKILGT